MSRHPTPLRDYLDRRRMTIAEMQRKLSKHLPQAPSQPSMSQWSSGRRTPSAHIQMAMMLATDGEVTPLDWARWSAESEKRKHRNSERRDTNPKIQAGGGA